MDIVIEQINSAGKTFIEFAWPMLWQVSVLTAILLAADWLLRRRVRAVFRYWLWMLVLAKLFLPTTLSSPVSIGLLTGNALPTINIAATEQPVGGDIPNVFLYSPRASETGEASVALHAKAPIQSQAVTPIRASLTWQGGIFLVWLMVVCAMLLLLVQRAIFVCGLVRQSAEVNGLMNDALKFCCSQMGVRQTIRLKVSPNATSPAVCGLFRPVILVPQGLGSSLGINSLRVVLMHELAHIKRGDLWVNLLQTVLQIAYFYNPLLWLANWAIRRVREQAVDEAVQVALGERAQQYPETLLNVARLAFERPTLSLRLIGVVESKSALTSRIKRMLTRPIPKTAKLGIIGSFAIIILAAVLLPMAKAAKTVGQTTENREITEAPFTAKLDNGVTVELTAVCGYPNGETRCWMPDGSKLEKQIYVKREGLYQDGKYGFIMRVDMPLGSELGLGQIEGVQHWYSSCAIMDSGVEINGFPSITWENNKPREKGYMASITKEYDGGETTNIRVYVATGQWNTAAEHDGRSTAAKDGFIFSKAYEADGGVNIVVSGKSQKDQEQQIVAIDTNGISHPISNDSMGCNDVRQMSGRFNNIKPSQIKEFRVQTRPYQWIEFRNVSLRPGVKTDVQVLQQAPQPIGFKITSREFQNGDSIEITGLSGPAGVLRPGQTYIVSGKYTLKSHDDAALHVYATNGETSSSQGPIMKRGEGQFTRSFTLLKEGDLHLSFYPAEGGDSFGGVYFTQRGADTGTETGAEVVDVAVENFDIRPYPEGGLYTLTVSIRNRGREESPKLGVNFYRGDPNNLKPMMHEAGPIKPGDVWREGSMPFALREGTNVISVVIDPANQIPESNEMNNRAWITVVVKDGKIVKKKVSLSSVHTAEFPEKEDLSTPETAYASINRVSASGDQAGWQRVSVKEIAEKLAMENKNGKMKVEPEWAKVLLNAKIIEVRICDSNIAVVFAELPQEFTSEPIRKPIDVRYLKLEDGKWLNTGNDRVWTIEEARAMFDKVCGKSVATNE